MKRIGFIDGRRIAGWVFPANATPGNGQVMTVLDPSTPVGSYTRGRHLSYTATGDKTGAGNTLEADSVALAISGNSQNAYGRATYISASGDPVINYLSGHFIYMGDIGASAVIKKICALDMGVNVTNAPTEQSTFIRAYSHGGEVRSFAWLPSSQGITYLFEFEQAVAPMGVNTPGGGTLNFTNWRLIKIRVAGGDRYLVCATGIA